MGRSAVSSRSAMAQDFVAPGAPMITKFEQTSDNKWLVELMAPSTDTGGGPLTGLTYLEFVVTQGVYEPPPTLADYDAAVIQGSFVHRFIVTPTNAGELFEFLAPVGELNVNYTVLAVASDDAV